MRALICGYYGFGNAGDEALLRALLTQLPSQWDPVVLSGDPASTQQLHRIPAIPRRQAVAVLTQERGVFLWGGGSLIQDRTSWRSPLVYLGLMGWAQRMGWTTIAWAQGLGPIERRWIQVLTRRSLQGCDAVSVRDVGSDALLQQWGIPHHLAPDPVWALEPQPVPAPSQAPCIAVIVRPHATLTPERLHHLCLALRQLQLTTTSQVLLLPFQLPQDLAVAEHIQTYIPSSRLVTFTDPQHLMGVLAHMHFTITMRYHGLVMAARVGSRCFGLSYDPKVSYLVQALGCPGWEMADLPRDPELIYQGWLAAYQGSPLTVEQRQQWQRHAQTHATLWAQALA
ncbi:MAG: polysaccharide pyruvyl transferase CsaB [Synechococcales cyanobacterium]